MFKFNFSIPETMYEKYGWDFETDWDLDITGFRVYGKTPFFSVWLQELLLQVTIPHILRGVGVFLVLSLTPGIPIRHR